MLETIRSKKISFWIKGSIFLIAASLLYYALDRNDNLDTRYLEEMKGGWKHAASLLVLAFLLIPLNLSLEALKWKYLIRKIEQITFLQAFEGIITGITMGFVTPHGLGDYLARILTLTNSGRAKGLGAVFLSRISQFYITLYFGTIALVFYVHSVIQDAAINYNLLVWFAVLNNVLFVFIFIYHQAIFRYIEGWSFLKKVLPYIEIIKHYSFREINYSLLLSFFRYLIFSFQFVLLLVYFQIELSWWLMLMGVSFIFFVKSVIPTFLDLGVRETAAVIFFGMYSDLHQNILFASLTLWLFNLVGPAMAGLMLIFKMRVFRK
ncbi:MAG TPA: lysylphosphatidylglycerol synthase domain-containing protein [Cytophagaceae bacterium]|nr:lysylphosphatidylglycerol synthase domain-containing protein [Cytophagaceae bacterium]